MKLTSKKLLLFIVALISVVGLLGILHVPLPVHLPHGLHMPHITGASLAGANSVLSKFTKKKIPVEEISIAGHHALSASEFNTPEYMNKRISNFVHMKLKSNYDVSHEPTPPIVPELLYWLEDGQHKVFESPYDRSTFKLFPKVNPEKYLLFGTDLGGFNNIRMSFEVYVTIAALTGRTLVLPPPHGWYLLDFGRPQDLQGPGGETSDYHEFWEMADLNITVPYITAQEFVDREKDFFQMPWSRLDDERKQANQQHKFYQFFNAYRAKPDDNVAICEASPENFLIYWPDIKTTETKIGGNQDILEHYLPGHRPYQLSAKEKEAKVLYMPMWQDSQQHIDYRFFTNAASFVLYAEDVMRREINRVKRNHMHYRYEIFYVASRVIRFLGRTNYTALHVRRGDLQYESSFIAAEATINNVKALLTPGETLYISTDEKPDFFTAVREAGHPVFTFKDFFTEKGGNVLSDLDLDPNMIGMVEQVIASQGRLFFGTKLSTFSAYIFRMRGYNKYIADKHLLYHNTHYTGDWNVDQRETKQGMSPHNWGMEYTSTWEDIY